ncbi:hypothetical protein [Paenibacillus endophyticus]|uniref:hypothetical protein n=1 Tax=Paenibacillus endophyticus TaxID=1294268 RepID=UPI001C850CC3|nr:hypothetical protein [Paenibacillus endophyticus]
MKTKAEDPIVTPTPTPVSEGGSTNNDYVAATGGNITVKTYIDGSGTLNARITEADLKKALEAGTASTLQITVDASNNTTASGLKVTIPVQEQAQPLVIYRKRLGHNR